MATAKNLEGQHESLQATGGQHHGQEVAEVDVLGHVAGVAVIEDRLPDWRVDFDLAEGAAAAGVRDGVLRTQPQCDAPGDDHPRGERQKRLDD